MMTYLHALVLGIVEGFTEFLPISSTAHLELTSTLLGISASNFTKTFEIAIQSGAILAVIILYWKKFLDQEVLKKIAIAFIPTGIMGLLFYTTIKKSLLGNTSLALTMLAVGGVLLIVFEYLFQEKDTISSIKNISYPRAFAIGIFQSIAIVPGVSRAAATIVGGMLVGIQRKTIVEFSFLLAVPTMLAATGLDLMKNMYAFSQAEITILGIGFFVSFITAIISIQFLLQYIRNHTFIGFGMYRIVLVMILLLTVL